MRSSNIILPNQAFALGVLLVLGCGGTKPSEVGPEDPKTASARSTARPTNLHQWAGKSVVAGQEGARFSFSLPDGLEPLEDMTPLDRQGDTVVFDPTSAGTVGKYENGYVAFNTIDVYSDPAGLGVDYLTLPKEHQEGLRSRYERLMKERYRDAGPVQVVEVGGRTAFRLDLRIVRTDDLPLRAGRHYLLIDGGATASVDCLWVPSDIVQMGAACDMIAQELKRVD